MVTLVGSWVEVRVPEQWGPTGRASLASVLPCVQSSYWNDGIEILERLRRDRRGSPGRFARTCPTVRWGRTAGIVRRRLPQGPVQKLLPVLVDRSRCAADVPHVKRERCPCSLCRQETAHPEAEHHRLLRRLAALLDERQRRLFAAIEARLGHGGTKLIGEVLDLDEKTVRRGKQELRAESPLYFQGRIRRPGGGRPRTEKKAPRWSID